MKFEFPIRSDKLSMTVDVSRHVASYQSQFQKIDIYDSDVYGKILFLDGHVQLSTFDEKAYHEGLVWIPLLNLENPKSALIVGGGDGGVLRELCNHKGLQRIDMVEIDKDVIDICSEHLPSLSGGSFNDPRVNLTIGDAFEFVKSTQHQYEIIVVDCTDVYEDEDGELSEMLFTNEFYNDLRKCLTTFGIVVTQADNPIYCPYSLDEIKKLYSSVFPNVGTYNALVPSFGGMSGYCWGSNQATLNPNWLELNIQRREFTYLNSATYQLAFSELSFA